MMAPNARRRRKFLGIWGAFYTKNTSPPGGQRPPQAENFGHLGGVVHKNHVAGMHSGPCFWRKTPPKILKISASGGPNPQILEKNPPLIAEPGTIRGGSFQGNRLISIAGRNSRKGLIPINTFPWVAAFKSHPCFPNFLISLIIVL